MRSCGRNVLKTSISILSKLSALSLSLSLCVSHRGSVSLVVSAFRPPRFTQSKKNTIARAKTNPQRPVILPVNAHETSYLLRLYGQCRPGGDTVPRPARSLRGL